MKVAKGKWIKVVSPKQEGVLSDLSPNAAMGFGVADSLSETKAQSSSDNVNKVVKKCVVRIGFDSHLGVNLWKALQLASEDAQNPAHRAGAAVQPAANEDVPNTAHRAGAIL